MDDVPLSTSTRYPTYCPTSLILFGNFDVSSKCHFFSLYLILCPNLYLPLLSIPSELVSSGWPWRGGITLEGVCLT